VSAWVKEKFFVSEEERVKRLIPDVISQSKENSKLPQIQSSSRSKRARKIYNLALRGGCFEEELWESVNEIQNFSFRLLLHLYTVRTNNKLFNLLIVGFRNYSTFWLKQ
jgi:hypothetical protein